MRTSLLQPLLRAFTWPHETQMKMVKKWLFNQPKIVHGPIRQGQRAHRVAKVRGDRSDERRLARASREYSYTW